MSRIPKTTWISVAVLLLASAAVATDGERFGAEGQRNVIAKTRLLETDPLGDKKVIRAEILTWWIEVPDINLKWCAGMLTETKNESLSGIIVSQGMFGAGVFILENPDRASEQGLRTRGWCSERSTGV